MNRRDWLLRLLGFFPLLRWLLKTPRSPEVVSRDPLADSVEKWLKIAADEENRVKALSPTERKRLFLKLLQKHGHITLGVTIDR